MTVMGKGLSKKEKKTIRKELASDKKKLMKEIRGEKAHAGSEKRAKKKVVRTRWCFDMHLRGRLKQSTVLEGEGLSQYHRAFRDQFGGDCAIRGQCEENRAFRGQCEENHAFRGQCEENRAFRGQCEENHAFRGQYEEKSTLRENHTLPMSPFCIVLNNGHTSYDVGASVRCKA